MIHERELPVIEALKKLNIEYKRYEHENADTMEKCEHIGEDVGAKHCKNLFLTNRQCTDFYLMLTAADKPFRTAVVSKLLGVSRLSFASNDLLFEKLGLLPGSVTPLALCHEGTRGITVVIDEDVASYEKICVHPCVSTASYAMQTKELLRFLHSCGNEIRYVTIMGDLKGND
ncbi:MAG: prolyl-tRNA synthetase associated domain-containing protein [Clostridia bacterium]|nr:prolyl-tRNA synthetase associated domain-containing protein [Clostridia bacterium]